MDKFNLEIDSYNKDELFDLLNCDKNSNVEELRKCYDKTVMSVSSDSKINNVSKKKIQTFLDSVYRKLKNSMENNYDEKILKEKQLFQQENAIIDTPFEDSTQTREKKIPIQVVSKDWTKGYVNPIQQSTVKKFINIDSRFRKNYYRSSSSDFTVELNDTLKNVTSFTIESSKFPKTLYNISYAYKNNQFNLIDASENVYTIEIPYGNYTSIKELCSVIETTMFSVIGDKTYKISEVPSDQINQNKVIFDGSGNNFTLLFNQPNRPLIFNLGWMLGFRQGQYINASRYFSDSHVDLNTYNTGYLEIDTFDNHHINHMITNFPESIFGNNLMAILSISSAGSITTDVKVNRTFFGPINIDKIKFKLLSAFGEPLDLQQMDYSLVLSAVCINE